jgi:transposase
VTRDAVVLSEDQHLELSRIAQSRSLPAGYVFRARLILMLAEGASYSSIKLRLGTTAPTISRWKQRFLAAGLDGLDTAHPGQKPSVLTAKLRARILAATRKRPKDGSTHWSCRKLAAALGLSKDAVHRVWQEAGLIRRLLEERLRKQASREYIQVLRLIVDCSASTIHSGGRQLFLPMSDKWWINR